MAGIGRPSKLERIKEYAKCVQSPVHYAEKYCQVFDLTKDGDVPFKLFPTQKKFVENCVNYRFNVVRKPRQTGVSTTTALVASTYAMFESKRKVLIIANKQDIAQEFLKNVKHFVKSAPEWMGITIARETQGLVELNNGSIIKAVATSEDALRGFVPTLLIMDEAAYIRNGEAVWTAAQPSLSTGGKAILISTPSGLDALYYAIYDAAKNKRNNFHITEFKWYEDPRFNKQIKWTKGDMIIDTWINKAVKEEDFKDFEKLEQLGFTATSPWFEDMCRQLNGDQRKIAQELLGSFLGSGDNVIDEKYIEIQEKENVRTPIRCENFDNNMWIWEDPIKDHQYILSSDIGRGDSADYSTIEITDLNTGHQVAEYQAHVPPDYMGELIFKYANKYQAYCIVDITGGMGVATVLKLLELGLDNKLLHYDLPKSKVLLEKLKRQKRGDKIPGFNIGANRVLVVQEFERQVRQTELIVRSKRLTSEMKTFVYRNGRPDHMVNFHDDLIFAMAMGLFVAQTSFKNLKIYNAQTKAMLNSITANNSDYKDNLTPQTNYAGRPDTKEVAQQYSWLLTPLRK